MRALLIAIAFGLSAYAPSVSASPCVSTEKIVVGGGYLNGQRLRQLDDDALGVYAMGYLDALASGSFFGMNEACRSTIDKCTRGKTNVQLAAILRKFLSDNPEHWHEPANMLLYDALLKRCLFPQR
jgi:hypothetical protein